MPAKRKFTHALVRGTGRTTNDQKRESNPVLLATKMCFLLVSEHNFTPPEAWMSVRPRLIELQPKCRDIHTLFPQVFDAARVLHRQSFIDHVNFASLCVMVLNAIEVAPDLSLDQKISMQALLAVTREGRTLLYPPHPFSEEIVVSMRRLMAGAYNNAAARINEGDFGRILFADAQAWMVLIARQAAPDWDNEVGRPPGSSLSSIERHCVAVLESCVESKALRGECPNIGGHRQIARMFLHSVTTGDYLCLRRDWDRFREMADSEGA